MIDLLTDGLTFYSYVRVHGALLIPKLFTHKLYNKTIGTCTVRAIDTLYTFSLRSRRLEELSPRKNEAREGDAWGNRHVSARPVFAVIVESLSNEDDDDTKTVKKQYV